MFEGLDPQTSQAIAALSSVVIALCSLLAGLALIFNMLLAPVKEKQAVFESELKEVKQSQVRFESDLKEIKIKLDMLLKVHWPPFHLTHD